MATSASRTPGSAATREAASETSGLRIASVTSRPSQITRGASDALAARISKLAWRASSVGWRRGALEREQRDAAIHGAAVQVGEAERRERRAGDGRLAGAGRPVDRYEHSAARSSTKLG